MFFLAPLIGNVASMALGVLNMGASIAAKLKQALS